MNTNTNVQPLVNFCNIVNRESPIHTKLYFAVPFYPYGKINDIIFFKNNLKNSLCQLKMLFLSYFIIHMF